MTVKYNFNTDISNTIKQTLQMIYYLKEATDKLKQRNKIRNADTSEGGWKIVRQYERRSQSSSPFCPGGDLKFQTNIYEIYLLRMYALQK